MSENSVVIAKVRQCGSTTLMGSAVVVMLYQRGYISYEQCAEALKRFNKLRLSQTSNE